MNIKKKLPTCPIKLQKIEDELLNKKKQIEAEIEFLSKELQEIEDSRNDKKLASKVMLDILCDYCKTPRLDKINIDFMEILGIDYIDTSLINMPAFSTIFFEIYCPNHISYRYFFIYEEKRYYSAQGIYHLLKFEKALKNGLLHDKEVKKQKTYLMLDERNGYYKIGKSINPRFREKTLQSQQPLIKLLWICDENVESQLHKKYDKKCIRGEWFNLTDKEVNSIIEKYNFYEPTEQKKPSK